MKGFILHWLPRPLFLLWMRYRMHKFQRQVEDIARRLGHDRTN